MIDKLYVLRVMNYTSCTQYVITVLDNIQGNKDFEPLKINLDIFLEYFNINHIHNKCCTY